jgi:hypothetical protein
VKENDKMKSKDIIDIVRERERKREKREREKERV